MSYHTAELIYKPWNVLLQLMWIYIIEYKYLIEAKNQFLLGLLNWLHLPALESPVSESHAIKEMLSLYNT